MTTKMYHRVSTVIAGITITLLLSIIIVVWVQVGHGAFRTPQKDKDTNTTSIPENFVVEDAPTYVELTSIERKEKKKTYFESSHLDDMGIFADVELVKPMKISPPPLHDHDIIYDQLHNTQDHPPLRHHSGHFRHKTAEVWDPHPHYEIRAFGKTLDLELAYNSKFVSPNFHVTRMWENFTQRINHDASTLGCYYTGKVKGEEDSAVSVSLCNGMTGYIQTSQGNYHIEPIEPFSSNSVTSILHRIKLTKHNTEITDNDVQDGNSEACETRENTIVTKNWPSPTSEEHEHVINKRNVRFDYVETDYYYDTSFEKRRSIRDISASEDAFEFLPVRRKSGNQEYHIEILIVADKTMSQYHNTKDDLTHYILTLMSHVSLLYKDVTVGNPISLAVVKILILDEMEFTSPTSEEMLKKFCDYQTQFNTNGEYDIALLLTREDICKNSTANQCNTLGVAEVGSMCNRNSSCAIVKDKGLSTSYTISHELGHALSMPHDDDKRCLNFNGGVQANNIMSKVVLQDTKPWLWSACSKHFLTEFLESHRASCLLDTPSNDFITANFTNAFPGEYFEVDTQCEMEFGKGYVLCPYPEMPLCESLWCTTEYSQGCKTQHMPWADGTRCGKSSWCHHGECITLDRNLLRPIPGGWGSWQEWEPCSRTCGGGIKISRRACDSPPPENGGAYCIGNSIRYGSCNIQHCEQHSPDFREVQCAEFNGMNKGIPGLSKNVKWIPKYGISHPDEVCKLYCRVQQTSSYYKLKEKVTDGTKCALNTFDICVHGVCRPGGCDNQLESKTTLDECGVCGGDNSKCTEISGAYNDSSYGYTRVVRIPKGSSNLYIQQKGYQNLHTDDNYLALVDAETGSYILNGNFIVSGFLKDVVFSGMTITYSGAEQAVEHIKTPKNRRLKKDLILEVLSVGKLFPPDISYRYTIRKDSDSKYGWYMFNEKWSACTSLCNGIQVLRPSCVALATFSNVSDIYCSNSELHSKIQERACNTHCHFEWHIHSRGPCSSHCGIGARTLYHNCMQINKQSTIHNHKRKVNDKHCFLLSKPPELESCEGSCESTRWEYEEWSQCSKTCGGGIQIRNAKCVDNTNELIDESLCSEKITEQICNTVHCPIWSYAEWTPCSVTCGKGYKSRAYFCHLDGHSLNPDACDQRELLATQKDCTELPCVNWYASPWSVCNVSCGAGYQSREVVCKTHSGAEIDDDYCNHILKPNGTIVCSLKPCYKYDRNTKLHPNRPDGLIREVDEYEKYESEYYSNNFEDNSISSPKLHHNFQWVVGLWNNCSKKCGTGTKSRMVVCRNQVGRENKLACPFKKPVISEKCNEHACPQWKFAKWGECDVDCMQYRQVICQKESGLATEDEECGMISKPDPSRACCMTDKRRYTARPIDENKYHHNIKYTYKWKFGKWNRCSKSCGRGTKARSVRCIELHNNVTVVDQFCRDFKKPKTSKPCERYKCSYMWREGAWGDCSNSCGYGVKFRNVTCHKVLREGFVDPTPLPYKPYNGFSKNYCDLNSKPMTKNGCIMKNCDDEYSWYASPWSKCSQLCGKKGRQTRSLTCKNRNGDFVKQHFCPKIYKLKRKRKCNQNKCIYRSCKEIKVMQQTTQNGDYYILVDNKVAAIYCYKMDTEEPEEFISLDADVQNYAEFYNKALLDRDSCPSNNRRQDNCDCELLDEANYGYTIFWKIRLNITYLQIIGDDFTFSRQINGKRIAYGTSGDCYSKQVECTQGTFSIDLSRTSFKLANNVRWIHNGNMATSKVDKQDRVVRGRCGGYCGSCLPDPNYGLAVEVT